MISNSPPPPNPEVLVIAGPTATGKTVIGAHVAKALGSEVISVDSQIIYQDLKIGVNRPTESEMMGVPHHMVAVARPDAPFSASDFADMAQPILQRILAEGKIPVLVGGTGFYIRSLLQPAHVAQAPPDPAYRKQLKARLAEEGNQALYNELQDLDPTRAAQLHPNDTFRVIRALEVIHQTGQAVPPSPVDPGYRTMFVGLTYADRVRHVALIRQRLVDMVEQGFPEEVAELLQRYGHCFALDKAHGYPELVEVIEGKRSLDSAIDQIEINIRRYSKRQMTWFRKLPGIQWYTVDTQPQTEIVQSILAQLH